MDSEANMLEMKLMVFQEERNRRRVDGGGVENLVCFYLLWMNPFILWFVIILAGVCVVADACRTWFR